jgi:pimeloyl-ACP methyl ester carboxylesterase
MQPEDKFVTVRGVRLHYVDWGSAGPPLLLFHGDQRSSRSWDAVARRLRDRFHVLAFDSRGHGESDWTPRGYRTSARVADFLAFLEAAGLRGLTMAAHSTGAGVVTFAALQRPDLFQHLFLIEPLLLLDEKFQRNVMPRETGTRRFWPSRQEYYHYLLWHRATNVWAREVAWDVAHYEARELPDGRVESMWAPETFNAEERRDDFYDLRSQLADLRVPTCILLSGNRSGAEIGGLEAILPTMLKGNLVIFQGVGHNVYMEQPQITADLIADHVAGRALPGRIQAPARDEGPQA